MAFAESIAPLRVSAGGGGGGPRGDRRLKLGPPLFKPPQLVLPRLIAEPLQQQLQDFLRAPIDAVDLAWRDRQLRSVSPAAADSTPQ